MKCPAMCLTTKKTYERDFIIDWVAKNGNDPLHLDPVDSSRDIAPNLRIYKIVKRFCKETLKDKGKKSNAGGGESGDKMSFGCDAKAEPTSNDAKAEDYRNEQAAREKERVAALSAKRNQLKRAAEEMEAVEAKMRNQMTSLRNELRASRALRQSQRKSVRNRRNSPSKLLRRRTPVGSLEAEVVALEESARIEAGRGAK